MTNILTQLKKFVTNYKFSLPAGAVLLLIGYFIYVSGTEAPREDFVVATRTTIAQEVSVTGRVEPAKSVELSVQAGGKVSSVRVIVGQKVAAGPTLLTGDP